MLQYIRLASLDDLPQISQILTDAKQFLKAAGSSQWQGNYPAPADIEFDIQHGYGWVLTDHRQVLAYAAVIIGEDPNYAKIEGGSWVNNDDPCATIHRLAISNQVRGQGLANSFLNLLISQFINQGIKNFRIDTGLKNEIVQHLSTTHGFSQRGIIYVTEDSEDNRRWAYELNI